MSLNLVVTLSFCLSTMVSASEMSKIDREIAARYREITVSPACQVSIRTYLINQQIKHYNNRGFVTRSQQLQDYLNSPQANDVVSVIYDTQEQKYRVEVGLDSSILNYYSHGYGIISWLTQTDLDQIDSAILS